MVYGEQAPLSSLYDLQADDYSAITSFFYIDDDGRLTCPRVYATRTTIHKIKRVRRDQGTVYFDYVRLTYYSSADETFGDTEMLCSKDGRSMLKKDKYSDKGRWSSEESATITASFRETDSIIYKGGQGNGSRHVFAVTWTDVARIVHNDTYDEIRNRFRECTGCTLALTVKETEDFFGKSYDTTGISVYRPGYWWSAGFYGEYGWVGFIRPVGYSGPFYMHRIRTHTGSRLQGMDR
jgi:hypothetical protein